ncbi:PHP domain-containing protein [bacterium]|nr:MAG: PHP domain-containing protein [bacterium]
MVPYHSGRMETLIDLHTHSHHSDGTLAPAALVELAAARGVSVLALTDHDTTAGCEEARAACASRGIDFVPGIELTADWLGREIHVVGLGIDCEHAAIRAYTAGVLEQRRARVKAIGERLARERAFDGFDPGTPLLDGAAVPTRAHVARAIVARGLARDVQDAFDRHLARGRAGYVAAHWPALAEAVAAIRAAGGLAVLAHAHRYRLSGGQLESLCATFRAAGGEGLEVGLAGLSPNDYERLARLARRHQLAGSIGSDFHEPGVPWRPLGRWLKLPDQVMPLLERLRPRQGSLE